MTTPREVDAVLLVYHHFPAENAPTIMEHVESFGRYSRFPVFAVNTDRGFPRALSGLRFRAVLLHYSLFGGDYYHLGRRYRRYLQRERDAQTVTVAFFQDEHRYCKRRFEFLNRYAIDAVYTLLEPGYHDAVYRAHTSVTDIRTSLTGYVGDELIEKAERLFVPDDRRTIDVGYRGRQLLFFQGRGAQEKHQIGERFAQRAAGLGFRLDIDTREASRVYGDDWYRFVAQCRGMLGVEAGTSVFDLDDTARERTDALLAAQPDLDFDELERRVLHEYEDRIFYRTISPRHFEAAAFRVTQILYRGRYSGVMEPDVHYLALEKDFSNFDDVMARFADPAERRRITDRAYDDLIASGRWSYASFVTGVDEHLATAAAAGGTLSGVDRRSIDRRLRRWAAVGRIVTHPRWFLRNVPFPGRAAVGHVYRWVRRYQDAR